jgi:tetratricopeptide (TPR) repeat protein
MSILGTVLDIGKKILITAATRFATNMATKASNSFGSKPTPQRETKSKELTTLERRYLAEKDKRELIALEIQREQLHLQTLIHKENIELSLKQIQADYDKDRWAGILSRDETVDVLRSSQEKHHLLMLLSEPEISPSCPDSFKNDLPIAVRNELKQFMQSEYPFQNELYPVQFFGKFFESRIFDAHVKQYERLLNSVPTVVLYSQMTDENLYLHIHGWGFGDISLTETCTFNWEAIYEQFHKEGGNDKDAYKAIRKMIVALHQAFAAFCSDFYYLTVINPLHEPRLFHTEFTEELQMVVEPLKQSLQTICEHNRLRYEENLLKQEQKERENRVVSAYQDVEKYPDSGFNWISLGDALENADRLEEAIFAYKKAIELGWDSYSCNRSLVYVLDKLDKLGRVDEAIAAYKKAMKLNSDPSNSILILPGFHGHTTKRLF